MTDLVENMTGRMFRHRGFTVLPVLAALALVLSTACSESSTPQRKQAPRTAPTDPQFEPVKKVKEPLSVSIVRPERDASRALQAAKDSILGLHVPTGFVLRTKRPGAVFGAVYTYEKNLTKFYRDLGYHVMRHERGYKFSPSRKVLELLSKTDRTLAQSTAIYSSPTRARWWSLQILSTKIDPTSPKPVDPMSYIHEAPSPTRDQAARVGERGSSLHKSGVAPAVRRRYKKPRNTIDLRPKLREWVRTNPRRNFLD
jgi:hypothetical protein